MIDFIIGFFDLLESLNLLVLYSAGDVILTACIYAPTDAAHRHQNGGTDDNPYPYAKLWHLFRSPKRESERQEVVLMPHAWRPVPVSSVPRSRD